MRSIERLANQIAFSILIFALGYANGSLLLDATNQNPIVADMESTPYLLTSYKLAHLFIELLNC